MEVMEDGNLMDKVHILIQRDMEYYKTHQAVLQETICPGVVGGRLDFPRSASFAAMKLVLWWEDEYVAAYRKHSGFLQKCEVNDQIVENSGGCGGIVKASDPSKFISLISKSAEQLLEHLHILTQEALDHADLTVLTGTIGAAALLKNCLRFYLQSISEVKGSQVELLHDSYKKYQEMGEALAERLLDLHCRLLSLYILQEAESLDWENQKPFCESERGSYVIQMWWLYMQGVAYAAYSSGVIDPLISGLACQATSQLKILKNNLQHLNKYANEKTKDNSIYIKIKQCIEHHDAVLSFVKEYEECFSLVVFSQFVGSVFVICVSCLQLSMMKLFSFNFFSMLMYLITMLAEIYLYCYYGTALFEESNSLTTAIYMGNWYEYDAKSKTALIIFMERSKRPMIVTAGKILDLSLVTFTTILRRSYSLLAVLKNY